MGLGHLVSGNIDAAFVTNSTNMMLGPEIMQTENTKEDL